MATGTGWEEPGSEGVAWDPLQSQSPGVEGRRPRGSRLLGLASVLLEFGVHDFECGQEVAEEEDKERKRQHEHLGGRHAEKGVPRAGKARQKAQEKEGKGRAGLGQLSLLKCPPRPPGAQNPLGTSYLRTAAFASRRQRSGLTG